MLTLFPFEADFYTQHRVKAVFVGHPLADAIPLVEDQRAARVALQLPLDAPIVAILPGSRRDEIARLGPVFLQAAQQCLAAVSTLQFVVPMVNETRAAQFRALNQTALPITVVIGQSSHAMVAADVILLASGTATLEAMLHKKPMVVAYKLSAIAYAIAKRLIKVKYIALPNLLSDQALVPELIQDQATAANISRDVLVLLSSMSHYPHHTQFTQLHHQLQQNASEKAAQSVVALLNG
jgi:lipid-A-disaccharide synthase